MGKSPEHKEGSCGLCNTARPWLEWERGARAGQGGAEVLLES